MWADGLFKKRHTEVKPFRDSSALVTDGPYRFTRQPMYVGGLVILLGANIVLGSVAPFAIVVVAFGLIRSQFVLPEEEDMERQFGERYVEYKRRVRRWL